MPRHRSRPARRWLFTLACLATLALPGCAGSPALPVLLGGTTADDAWSGAIRISRVEEFPQTTGACCTGATQRTLKDVGSVQVVAAMPARTYVSKAAPLSAPVAPLSASSAYKITDLGTLGGTSSEAYDINLAGTVVGSSATITGTDHAVVWYTAIISGNAVVTGTVDLSTLGGISSMAYGVSGNGRVAGASALGSGVYHAFEWSAGSLTDLVTLPGGTSSGAYDVNLAGIVVGSSVTTDTAPYPPGNHAFKWQGGTMTDLGTLPDGLYSGATAINDNNTIVGYAHRHVGSSWYPRAVRWQGSAPEELGVLPGQTPPHTYSGASDINSLGQIVGDSHWDPSGMYTSPFYWSMGTMTDLLEGQNRSTFPYGNASGINNRGQVVGVAGSTSSRNPVLWDNGTMSLLQDLIPAGTGWDLKYAYAINDHGQIVGYGTIGGQTHAFIMTPVQRVFLPLIWG